MLKLLDHGSIKLSEYMGSDLSISHNARVLDLDPWRGKDDVKLINYLMNNNHNTPFEAVSFNFYVKAPIFVIRQWHRHRTWSYNERSARYEELPEEFYVPEPHMIGTQSKKNHQSRIIDGTQDTNVGSVGQAGKMRRHNEDAFSLYRELLADGVPRELARTVLPFATYTVMYAKVNLHNLFGFLSERMSEHAQYEIRVYAEAMFDLIAPIVPVAAMAFWVHRLERRAVDFDIKYGNPPE